MKTIKFHNKTVAINRVRIGVVVSNINSAFWGHIVGFGTWNEDADRIEIKWAEAGVIQEFPEDLVIWE